MSDEQLSEQTTKDNVENALTTVLQRQYDNLLDRGLVPTMELPSPEELAKYKEVDPEVLGIIKSTLTGREAFYKEDIIRRSQEKNAQSNGIRVMQLSLSFLGMGLVSFLGYYERWGIATLLTALTLLLVYAINPEEKVRSSVESILRELDLKGMFAMFKKKTGG